MDKKVHTFSRVLVRKWTQFLPCCSPALEPLGHEDLKKMKCIKFFGLFEKQTDPLIPAEDYIQWLSTRNKNLLSSRFCRSSRPQRENKTKRKVWQILKRCWELGIKSYKWPTIYRPVFSQRSQNKAEKCGHCMDWRPIIWPLKLG